MKHIVVVNILEFFILKRKKASINRCSNFKIPKCKDFRAKKKSYGHRSTCSNAGVTLTVSVKLEHISERDHPVLTSEILTLTL